MWTVKRNQGEPVPSGSIVAKCPECGYYGVLRLVVEWWSFRRVHHLNCSKCYSRFGEKEMIESMQVNLDEHRTSLSEQQTKLTQTNEKLIETQKLLTSRNKCPSCDRQFVYSVVKEKFVEPPSESL